MQIKNRLTLLFTLLIAGLLLAFALVIYISSSESRENEYFKRLKQQAATKANLLFDTKVEPHVLQLIYKNAPNALFQEEVAVYDTAFNLLYHDAVEVDKVKETKGMIDSILTRNEIQFYIKDVQVVGFVYDHGAKKYVVTAASKDEYGLAKLVKLRNTLIVSFLVAVILIFFVGRFLAKQALKPVATLINRVKNITATNLDLRVDEGNRKDEIASLAITFNEMLNRLEKSFDSQKEFVSNISHELRTPLTAMLAELQLTTVKERSTDEYKHAIEHIIDDTQKLVRLSNSLLDLAKANYDQTEIMFKEVRLDEILLDARNDVLHNYPRYRIKINYEKDDESSLAISGNEYLLRVAFINLIENGCKFSDDNQSSVLITSNENNILLKFSDRGVGIPDEDLPHIFTAFYRGNNKHKSNGNGIGLPLSKKIIQLHNGSINVNSAVNQGTTFTVGLQRLKTT